MPKFRSFVRPARRSRRLRAAWSRSSTALGALACLAAFAGTAEAIAQDAPGTVAYIHANVITAEDPEPIEDATVIVAGGEIVRIESDGAAVPAGAAVVDLGGRYLLPGMIDAHVHFGGFDDARRALHSGVTTVRSMGASHFSDVGMRELAAAGRIDAPEIVAAGYHVRPEPAAGLFMDVPRLGDLLATGVRTIPAIRRMAEALIEHGVDFLKVNATERAGLPQTDPRVPFYDEAQLRALVEAGASAGIPVAAHAHGDVGARAAVRAGVRSIEHGTYLTDETLALMAERGTYLVPTIAIVSDLTIPGGDYDNAVLQIRGRHMLPRVRRTAASAHRAGVAIVAATDTGYGPESTVRLGHELEELVGIGLSPFEAIRSATTVAAELLGVDDHTGRIAEGFDADLIVVDRNPLEDIRYIQDVLLVVNDGEIVLDRLDLSGRAAATAAAGR